MEKSTGQSRFFPWTILFLLLLASSTAQAATDSLQNARIAEASSLRITQPDRAIRLLDDLYDELMAEGDTVIAIRALTALAVVYGNMANYGASCTSLWKALLLADQAHLDEVKLLIKRRIGRYYAFYKRRDKALGFFTEALELHKSLVEKGQMAKASLTRAYLPFCTTFTELKEFELAQTYLDSCFLYQESDVRGSIRLPFLQMQQAFLDVENGRTKTAIDSIESLIPWFETELPTYRVLVYSYLGDAYLAEGAFEKSEWCYRRALEVSETMHSHVDFSILVHEKLAGLYADQGNYQNAYGKLRTVYALDKQFFDSRSTNNISLLEIQDQFRNAMEAQEQLLREKRIAELEHENRVRFLRNIIISVLAGSLALFGMLFFYYLRNRHRVEKHLIELEMKTDKELLDLKNRELAASALKLFEKDKFLQELKTRIAEKKDKISMQEVKHLIKTVTTGNTSAWKAFEAQFISVNGGFYEELRTNYPDLTPGERKLCALIKLKLTSKEIAGLMRISVDSVHKSRYRLRKKLNLEKEVDLTDFMAGVN